MGGRCTCSFWAGCRWGQRGKRRGFIAAMDPRSQLTAFTAELSVAAVHLLDDDSCAPSFRARQLETIAWILITTFIRV